MNWYRTVSYTHLDVYKRQEQYRLKVGYLSPENQIREKRQQLAELEERLGVLMEGKVTTARHRMMLYVEKLRAVSYTHLGEGIRKL